MDVCGDKSRASLIFVRGRDGYDRRVSVPRCCRGSTRTGSHSVGNKMHGLGPGSIHASRPEGADICDLAPLQVQTLSPGFATWLAAFPDYSVLSLMYSRSDQSRALLPPLASCSHVTMWPLQPALRRCRESCCIEIPGRPMTPGPPPLGLPRYRASCRTEMPRSRTTSEFPSARCQHSGDCPRCRRLLRG